MKFELGQYRRQGDRYLRSYLVGMSRPAPWPTLKAWVRELDASDGASAGGGPEAPRRAWDLVLGQRDQNIVRLWSALQRIGLEVTGPEGEVVRDEAEALEVGGVFLRRPPIAPLRPEHRTGFFTHSVVGNALLLLTAPWTSEVAQIARRPNRHILDNARPVDLGPVVIIRHGRTLANERGILLGRSDSLDGWGGSLMDMTPRPCPAGVRSWHCSTLTRTRQTAAVFGVEEPAVHAGLDEMDIGVAEGRPQRECVATLRSVEQMQRGDPFVAIVDEQAPAPGAAAPAECFVDVLVRVFDCLRDELGFERAP